MVPHVEVWEILSIEGMVFIAAAIFAAFVILFGSCQICLCVYKKDVLRVNPPVSGNCFTHGGFSNIILLKYCD